MENVGGLYGYLAWLAGGVFLGKAKKSKNPAFKMIRSAFDLKLDVLVR
ncbi:MAG: hypothetical protein ACKVE4_02245 [Dissulfuribacterales bacterium]